jgi:hypothetical protein
MLIKNGEFVKVLNQGKGKFGTDNVSYIFRVDGKDIGLNKVGQLAWLVDNNLSIGDRCNITLLGKESYVSKGVTKEGWKFEMEVAESNAPRSQPVAATVPSTYVPDASDISL